MYFPYFRGRQYELLALKELVSENRLSESVIPVVEPVKLMATFDGTLRAFASTQNKIALIFNPSVGNFANIDTFVERYCERQGDITTIAPALLMSKNTETVLNSLVAKGVEPSTITVILDDRDFLEVYKARFTSASPRYTLFPDEREFRRTVLMGKVMFKDNFNKKQKNAAYPEDEFFTEDHLFYKAEGYSGFGDYSIIGNEYVESGFAPYAVAIHIVYFDDDCKLRVRHFISDSNEDISDVAGKFNEAVTKLKAWYTNGQQRQKTSALATLLHHADIGYYPGLPTIKKLSIMHHLELMGKYLDGGITK